MKRSVTNAIRLVMDECIPPIVRDSRWFMYPFFLAAYRGRNVQQAMDFKRLVHQFSPQQYADFYASLNTISRNRATDLNEASIVRMLESIPVDAGNLLDVGCGRGYFLHRVHQMRPDLDLIGCDVVDKLVYEGARLVQGRIESLPFDDDSFDVVTCSHTLEHVLDPARAVAELRRVARRLLFVAVPCQRYYYYTLDEHLNFYPQRELLVAQMGLDDYRLEKIHGDWLYQGSL